MLNPERTTVCFLHPCYNLLRWVPERGLQLKSSQTLVRIINFVIDPGFLNPTWIWYRLIWARMHAPWFPCAVLPISELIRWGMVITIIVHRGLKYSRLKCAIWTFTGTFRNVLRSISNLVDSGIAWVRRTTSPTIGHTVNSRISWCFGQLHTAFRLGDHALWLVLTSML